jgi:hypothetical protein
MLTKMIISVLKCSRHWQTQWIPPFNISETNLLPPLMFSCIGPKALICVAWDMVLGCCPGSSQCPAVKVYFPCSPNPPPPPQKDLQGGPIVFTETVNTVHNI